MTLPNLSDWLQHEVKGEDLVAIAALGVLTWTTIRPLITLPTEPTPLTTLPVNSKFSEHILEPFVLRSAFGHQAIGKVSFEGENLVFQNYLDWAWVCCRVLRQNTIHVKWVWKDLGSSFMIPEVWVAYPWRLGRTAMIKFVNGEAFQILIGHADKFLCKVDAKQWVEMVADANYEGGNFDLSINGSTFTLEMLDEPIGIADYIQIQFSLQGLGRVAIREMTVS